MAKESLEVRRYAEVDQLKGCTSQKKEIMLLRGQEVSSWLF